MLRGRVIRLPFLFVFPCQLQSNNLPLSLCLSLILGGSQPAVYPEGFAPAHHGDPEDEVQRHVHSGTSGDRRPGAGGETVAAARGSEGT